MRFVGWTIFLILLAGCSATPDVADAPTQPVDSQPDEPVVWETFTGSFALTINPDPRAVAVGGVSENCVFFWETSGANYVLGNGTVTLTWDALPNTPTFSLRATGGGDVAPVTGGSPLVLTFDALPYGHSWGTGFWADYSVLDGTMPAAQQATLEVELEYQGVLPAPGVGTCAGGGV